MNKLNEAMKELRTSPRGILAEDVARLVSDAHGFSVSLNQVPINNIISGYCGEGE